MERHLFYDEPPLKTMVSYLDEPSRLFLEEAADREREGLPLFPAHFKRFWELEGNGCSETFDFRWNFDKDSWNESDHG